LSSKISYRPILDINTSMKTEKFIAKAREIHGDVFDYINTVYNSSKVQVTCRKHGDFLVSPGNHLSRKSGCPKCANE